MASTSAAVVLFSSLCTMVLGARLGGGLGVEGGRAVSRLYASLVFPAMVFRGVSAIQLSEVDTNLLLSLLLSKLLVAGLVLAWAGGEGRGMGEAAAYAMAASHSFDVTLGVPLCSTLFPSMVGYIFLNQAAQLALVNPLLLLLMEVGKARQRGTSLVSTAAAVAAAVATNPLVLATLGGLAAGRLFPQGLPAVLAALSKQLADAGGFLGFVSLGLAMGNLGSTSARELSHAAVLCAAKLALMPFCYSRIGGALGAVAPAGFLVFLGSLPASASVYSLTLTRDLAPRVVGPLVPVSMALSVALALLRDGPLFSGVSAPEALRWAIVGVAAVALLFTRGSAPKAHTA